MVAVQELVWDDHVTYSNSRCGCYAIRYELRPVRFVPHVFEGWEQRGPARYVGPAFPSLESAKSYCESDSLLGDS